MNVVQQYTIQVFVGEDDDIGVQVEGVADEGPRTRQHVAFALRSAAEAVEQAYLTADGRLPS